MMTLGSVLAFLIHDRVTLPTRRPRRNARRGPFRSPHYRAWVRTFPCVACGQLHDIEAAHTGPHAMSQKASDLTCIPLCPAHHRAGNVALDKIGRAQFEAVFQISIEAVVEELNQEWRRTR